MAPSVLSLLFGKKRKKRGKGRGKKRTGGKKKKRIGFTVKGQGRKAHVVMLYKFEGKPGKRYYSGTRTKKRKMTKSEAVSKVKKLKRKSSSFGRRRAPVRRRRRMSSFGVGGSYMPSASFMSPYPSSLSGPAWI